MIEIVSPSVDPDGLFNEIKANTGEFLQPFNSNALPAAFKTIVVDMLTISGRSPTKTVKYNFSVLVAEAICQ
jgi:hypothetical protein